MERAIKWTQWEQGGMIRCGIKDYRTIIKWVQELGHDAKECLHKQEKPHAIYARIMHDDDWKVTEIRLYCNAYLDDDELDRIAAGTPNDTLYVVHK